MEGGYADRCSQAKKDVTPDQEWSSMSWPKAAVICAFFRLASVENSELLGVLIMFEI